MTRFDDRGLTDSDAKNFESARAALEGKLILFARGSSELTPTETAKLADLARELTRLTALEFEGGATLQRGSVYLVPLLACGLLVLGLLELRVTAQPSPARPRNP